MKIIKLQSENIKRLSAVEITPDGALVTIGGKNGVGKSSVLDSIAYALGGEKLVPTQPIRAGEAEAKIVIDLGDLVVTRRFRREHLPCSCGVTSPGDMPIVGDDQAHLDKCAVHKFGETSSSLMVTNKDGAKYPSPQSMLDKLLGNLTFDPLAFKNEPPKKQDEILRTLTNLDFSVLNTTRKEAFDRRAMHKKTLTLAENKLAELRSYPDAPAAEIPIDDVLKEIKRGEELRKAADEASKTANDAQRAITETQQRLEASQQALAGIADQIKALQEKLETERKTLIGWEAAITAAKKRAEVTAANEASARAAVPNFDALDAKLRDVDATNQKVRANAVVAAQKARIGELTSAVAKEQQTIDDVDARKADALSAAQFPVAGLGLSDDGVTFEGLPFAEVSSSVQLRTSIAIGLAQNPTLKVLLIRNGNLLDDDSLALVAQQASDANAQVWCEYVTKTSDAEGMAVMLEDGHIKA